jgi:hypothetical protein
MSNLHTREMKRAFFTTESKKGAAEAGSDA